MLGTALSWFCQGSFDITKSADSFVITLRKFVSIFSGMLYIMFIYNTLQSGGKYCWLVNRSNIGSDKYGR